MPGTSSDRRRRELPRPAQRNRDHCRPLQLLHILNAAVRLVMADVRIRDDIECTVRDRTGSRLVELRMLM